MITREYVDPTTTEADLLIGDDAEPNHHHQTKVGKLRTKCETAGAARERQRELPVQMGSMDIATRRVCFVFCAVLLLFSSVLLLLFSTPSRGDPRPIRSPTSSSSFNVLVVGDWGRLGLYNQSEVAAEMGVIGGSVDPQFIISTGDNFYENGLSGVDDPQFGESFSNIYTAESLQKTWHTGNHDYRGDVLAQLDPELAKEDSRWHCLPNFSVTLDLGGSSEGESADFFFYDTTPLVKKYWTDSDHDYDWRGVQPLEDYMKKQQEFLSSALEVSNATWKIVVGHHPVRSVGDHGDTEELLSGILPLLQQYNVDLYVNGHDHCLEDIVEDGIHFLTSGGGSKAYRGMNSNANVSGLQFFYDGQGFMALSISPSTLQFTFYDIYGSILHQNQLSKS